MAVRYDATDCDVPLTRPEGSRLWAEAMGPQFRHDADWVVTARLISERWAGMRPPQLRGTPCA